MTPWSDLEFAILINEDRPEFKEYFRNLTKLLHIKVINLGETPLRSVGVESLNNFRSPKEADEWFWDELTNNGFSFDGPDWHACKTPLGRQKYKAQETSILDNGRESHRVVDKPDYELILTPKQMSEFQSVKKTGNTQEVNWFESDMQLVQSLRSVVLIEGSQRLLDDYRQEQKSIVSEEIVKVRALTKLRKDIESFSLRLGDAEEGKLFNVKETIYRSADRIIDDLANYYGIVPSAGEPGLTAWQCIDKMTGDGKTNKRVLTCEGAEHLKEALSIAAELRLATYSYNNGQKEGMSTYIPAVEHLSEKQKTKLIQETLYVKDASILYHFYYVMLRVQNLVNMLYDNEDRVLSELALKSDTLFDISNHTKGLVYARFLKYNEALTYLERAQETQSQDLKLLEDLLFLYSKTGKIEQAVYTATKLLVIFQSIYSVTSNHPHIATSYSHLGEAYRAKGEYHTNSKSIGYK